MSIFSERLSELRRKKDYTRKYVCENTGIGSVQVLANYEKGDRSPDLNIVADLARFYSVSADYLLGLSQHENPANADIKARLGLSDEAINTLAGIAENVIIGNYDELGKTLSDLIVDKDFMRALEIMHHLRFGSLHRAPTMTGTIRVEKEHAEESIGDIYIYRGARWEIERSFLEATDKILAKIDVHMLSQEWRRGNVSTEDLVKAKKEKGVK